MLPGKRNNRANFSEGIRGKNGPKPCTMRASGGQKRTSAVHGAMGMRQKRARHRLMEGAASATAGAASATGS